MSTTDEWSNLLRDHPIFSLPKAFDVAQSTSRALLELSTNTLQRYTNVDPHEDAPTPSGRRQTMILKDAEVIVAAGKEIRMSSVGDMKLSQSIRKSYKVILHEVVEVQYTYICRHCIHPAYNLRYTKYQ